MKKQKIVLFILFIFEVIVLMLPFVIDGQSFKNGKISRTFNPYQVSNHMDWYKDHYGTHDWIAEAALDAVLADSSSKSKWEGDNGLFWTEKRRICFLIGTEVPDSTNNPKATSYTNLVLNNVRCTGMPLKTIMRFHSDDSSDNRMRPIKFTSFVDRASDWTFKAKKYLREGRCDAAAFYMGAITHLISDMSSWPHVLYHTEVDGSLDVMHKNFEKAVFDYTNDHYNRDKSSVGGFSYPTNFPVLSVDPTLALKLVAFDTRWDYSISKSDYYLKPYPSYVSPRINDAKSLYDTFSLYSGVKQKDVTSWSSRVKSRVQEHIDKAVKYIAYSINFIADAWAKGDNPKYCEDCQNNGNPNQSQGSGRLGKLGVAVSILVLLGLANSMVIPILQILAQSIGMKA